KRTFEGIHILDTYYVYDNYDNLTFVIPPLAAAKPSIDQQILDKLCYQYRYNEQNHLTEKKLPGKGKEYMVYDKQNRLVATQDANLRAENKWIFTKYDKYNRVVYTGITTGSMAVIKGLINSSPNKNNEQLDYKVGFTQNGQQVMYFNTVFPTNITELFTVNYYDDYGFDQEPFPNVVELIDATQISEQNKVNTRG